MTTRHTHRWRVPGGAGRAACRLRKEFALQRSIRKRAVAGAASLARGVGLFAGHAPSTVNASSHPEAPRP